MNTLELTNYLNLGARNIYERIIKNKFIGTKELMFLYKFKKSLEKSAAKRLASEKNGLHIPAFLISSITSNCNLFCKGCYARANNICSEKSVKPALDSTGWKKIFSEAAELGVSFNLLAGGEPLLRKDVLTAAAETKEMVFPVFTNGTLIDEEYAAFFDRNRNIIPVVSLEGGEKTTDSRRGKGTYQKLTESFEQMKKKKLLHGISVTVSKENLDEITDQSFMDKIAAFGCSLVFFIEYVPVDRNTAQIAFDDNDREILANRQEALRKKYDKILFLSFPGDEKYLGGCLAAGRGFFHINSDGSAEACPFSPYSDCNVKEVGVAAALKSPLFEKIKHLDLTQAAHLGGCSLFAAEEKVKNLI
jgi:MoaA/NifB/PqqE/SkfB family radical SAM enzyme